MIKSLFAAVFLVFTIATPALATPERVMAVSWYGPEVQGNRMANGRRFDMNNPSIAAHRQLPLGTRLRLFNPHNGRAILVVVQDRGPFVHGRDLDVSRAAANSLGILQSGVGRLIVSIVR